MTKETFEEIARIINRSLCKGNTTTENNFDRGVKYVAQQLADYFEKESTVNENGKVSEDVLEKYSEYFFNKKQFLKECGVGK